MKPSKAMRHMVEHIDSLDTNLNYYISRVKDMPRDDMAELVTQSIRERLEAMRELAQRPTGHKDWRDKRAPQPDDEPITWPAPAGLFH